MISIILCSFQFKLDQHHLCCLNVTPSPLVIIYFIFFPLRFRLRWPAGSRVFWPALLESVLVIQSNMSPVWPVVDLIGRNVFIYWLWTFFNVFLEHPTRLFNVTNFTDSRDVIRPWSELCLPFWPVLAAGGSWTLYCLHLFYFNYQTKHLSPASHQSPALRGKSRICPVCHLVVPRSLTYNLYS